MKICTIIGARPQFIKAAAVSAKIAELPEADEVIIHTGQHYDRELSEVFFRELGIPEENYNLNVGSGSHGHQTGRMIEGVEDIVREESPDWVLVYGDTNSTLAGALAAVKLHIPVAHVEAGMRSFNREMPEEINRVVADHVSTVNFCASETALENLKNEGLYSSSVWSGDVMFDCVLKFADFAERHRDPFSAMEIERGEYVLMTCHRAENTDSPEKLRGIVEAANAIAESVKVVFPVHPRTRKCIGENGMELGGNVKVVPPVSYFEMLLLEQDANLIMTDSGGVQKEAFFFGVPCITMRDETEWIETVKLGWNLIVGADKSAILKAFYRFSETKPEKTDEQPYGDGDAASIILEAMGAMNTNG